MKLKTAPGFCHRLGTGLKAGADLSKLLASEASQVTSNHTQAIRSLADGIHRGETISHMMSQDPYFPPLMSAMVRAGEEAGKLEQALLTLSEHYQQMLATRRAFISSITWPLLQLVAGIGVISLLIYVLGILTPAGGGEMTDVLGWGLRGPQGVLIFWMYLTIGFSLIGFLIFAFFQNFLGVQNLIPLLYMIPVIGPAIQTITISRFCWTLALALGAGLDPIRSIKLSLDSTDSDYYSNRSQQAEDAIRRGATLAEALEATELFPGQFIQRIEVAELSGTDAESIDYLTREYDERAKRAITVLAGCATAVIRIVVILLFVYLIIKMAMTIFGAYGQALEPINRRGN